jgi:lipopolysaccharide export system permease protein
MNMFGRLDRYIFWQTLFGILVAAGAVCLAIILVDVVEQLRNVAGVPGAGTMTAVRFTLMRTPAILEQALPFAVLVGSIVTFMRLSRSSEVVAMRASGISTWRFISPVALLAAFVGLFTVIALSPAASRLNSQYEAQQQTLLGGTSVVGAGAGTGSSVWRRDRGDNQHYTINYQGSDGETYKNVSIYTFLLVDSSFVSRFDAKTATRTNEAWTLNNVVESRVGLAPISAPRVILKLGTTAVAQARDGDGSAKSIPVWALPSAARSAALSGGSPQRYWLAFHRKLALPVTLLAMSMIAAVLSLSTSRSGSRALMTSAAIGAGLIIYFINDFAGALATSGFAPSWIAAWAPPLTALFIAMATVSFREDG